MSKFTNALIMISVAIGLLGVGLVMLDSEYEILNERRQVYCVAIDEHTVECYGDIPKYDGMQYEVSSTLKPGSEYYVMINSGITKDDVTDDKIDFIGW